jgi:hypothetical protein
MVSVVDTFTYGMYGCVCIPVSYMGIVISFSLSCAKKNK